VRQPGAHKETIEIASAEFDVYRQRPGTRTASRTAQKSQTGL